MNLVITLDAWLHLQAAANFNPDREVAGFGRVQLTGEALVMDAVLIPPQEVGGAHAELDVARGDLDWLLAEILRLGDQPSKWCGWWHSHAKMATEPSFTDKSTLLMLAKARGIWVVGLVVGARAQPTAWLAAPHPVNPQAPAVSLPLGVIVEEYEDPAITASVADIMRKHVTTTFSHAMFPDLRSKPRTLGAIARPLGYGDALEDTCDLCDAPLIAPLTHAGSDLLLCKPCQSNERNQSWAEYYA